MIGLALLPVGLSVLLAVVGPRLARLLTGRVATPLLTMLCLVCALSVGLVLCAVGCLAVAQWAPFASVGHWSSTTIATHDPLPVQVDICCAVLASALIAASVARLVGLLRRLRQSALLCRQLSAAHTGSLIVLDDDRPEAYALAGLPGRTVVTRAMLRALSGDERRALLAHEQSHVSGYHFVYVNLVHLATTANPLLRPVLPAIRLAVERWADEDAVRAVGNRGVVVTALARAGLARSAAPVPVPRGALAAAASDLHVRVDSLVEPRSTRLRTGFGIAIVTVIAVCCIASSSALGLHLHSFIEWAQATHVHSHG